MNARPYAGAAGGHGGSPHGSGNGPGTGPGAPTTISSTPSPFTSPAFATVTPNRLPVPFGSTIVLRTARVAPDSTKTRSARGAPTIRSPTPSPLTSPRPATDSPKRAPAAEGGVEIGTT